MMIAQRLGPQAAKAAAASQTKALLVKGQGGASATTVQALQAQRAMSAQPKEKRKFESLK